MWESGPHSSARPSLKRSVVDCRQRGSLKRHAVLRTSKSEVRQVADRGTGVSAHRSLGKSGEKEREEEREGGGREREGEGGREVEGEREGD